MHKQVNVTGFTRLRRIMVVVPFVMPVLTLLCCSLAIRGIIEALYVLVVMSTVLLAARVVMTYKEYSISGKAGLGGFDFAVKFSEVVSKAVERGMTPDDAISGAFGFAIGFMLAHFGWTPRQIGENARLSAEHIDNLRKKEQL